MAAASAVRANHAAEASYKFGFLRILKGTAMHVSALIEVWFEPRKEEPGADEGDAAGGSLILVQGSTVEDLACSNSKAASELKRF
jgi:hypothetical protein